MSPKKKKEYPGVGKVSDLARPFWSVMIPTMERPTFLKLALQSVLEQNIPAQNMQIEVIGDPRTSIETQKMVEEMGKGRVVFYRHDQLKSQSEQWLACMRRAKGKWLHIFHDDDILAPGFYQNYERFIENNPEVNLVCSQAAVIDENGKVNDITNMLPEGQTTGIVKDALENLAVSDYIVAPSAVVKREIYEKIGGPDLSLHYALDWELFLRVTALGPIGYIHEPCVYYRRHEETVSAHFLKEAGTMDESYAVVGRSLELLPPEQRRLVWNQFKLKGAKRSLRHGRHFCTRNLKASLKHALWVLRLKPSLFFLVPIGRIIIFAFAHFFYRMSKKFFYKK